MMKMSPCWPDLWPCDDQQIIAGAGHSPCANTGAHIMFTSCASCPLWCLIERSAISLSIYMSIKLETFYVCVCVLTLSRWGLLASWMAIFVHLCWILLCRNLKCQKFYYVICMSQPFTKLWIKILSPYVEHTKYQHYPLDLYRHLTVRLVL